MLATSYDAIQLRKPGIEIRLMTWRAAVLAASYEATQLKKPGVEIHEMTWRALGSKSI